MGDMNVRMGNLQQDIEDFYKTRFTAGLEIRRSKDITINTKGKEFLEFCNDNGLIILNGRTKGDEEGNLTYVSNIGESVNDICMVSQDMLMLVEQFNVENAIWSDHLPIKLSFQKNNTDSGTCPSNLLPKLKWNETKKADYQINLNLNLQQLKIEKETIDLADLTNIIKLSAPLQNNNSKTFNPKNKWYNSECESARRKAFKSLNAFRKSKSQETKLFYLKSQQDYKNVCKKSKKLYQQQIELKINTVRDSRDWWRLAKEIKNQDQHVMADITASEFQAYFRDLLNPRQEMSSTLYVANYVEDSTLDMPFCVGEIRNMLRNVKLNKAPGEDRIPYEFIINATDTFLEQLAKTYSKILEECRVEETFTKSVIFPIFKKGDTYDPSNYRGISYMNCIAKIMMGVLNERLYNWVEQNNILTEYQAGFRKKYSTVDNIYNLASIVHIKLAEKKKVYAFFVDLKAAFDKISRQLLMLKLREMGVSTKFVNLLECIYSDTQSAVWTGRELSEYFETLCGLKQGCLLSPLLFALYINDLHAFIEGGLNIDSLNIRLLLYADDMVILAEDVEVLQGMIERFEEYCSNWNLEVNLSKSEIMVFRNGGRLSNREKWIFNGEEIRIVPQYTYLGVLLTPKMNFFKHVEKRNAAAKNSINATWHCFLSKQNINLSSKWKLFLAVCRAIQTYSAQVWGFGTFDEVDKLQRYFLKRVLKLPSYTPNYALPIETAAEDGHYYTLDLHLRYVQKTIFEYSDTRLPKQLTKILLAKQLFWVKEINMIGNRFGLHWDENMTNERDWIVNNSQILDQLKSHAKQEAEQRARGSSTRIFKMLDYSIGPQYITDDLEPYKISWIFKARCDLISLNGNRRGGNASTLCSLCNMGEEEDIQHFLGRCPVLREFRISHFEKATLNEAEIIAVLNGNCRADWNRLSSYINVAISYRKQILTEFI